MSTHKKTSILAILAMAWLGLAAGVSPAAAGPRVQVAETVHDFGTVFEDHPLIHTFIISNTGDTKLQVICQ